MLILCLLLVTGQVFDADGKKEDGTLEAALRRDVEFFSDSLCVGRKTGSPGNTDAAFYIIRRLRSLGYEVQMNTFQTSAGAVGRNLIAVPAVCRNAILVMSYYDGLGRIGERFYPGADGNASGVAAMLALAERFKGGRDIIFAFVDGHNANMAGAEALKTYLGRQRLRMVVNLDILGSTLAPPDSFWKNYLIVLGGHGYQRSLERANEGESLHLYYNYYGSRSFTDLFYRKVSDHKFFLERGIPVLMFTSGITMNTNREADTAATLDYRVFAQRVSLVGNWLDSRE